MNVKNIKLPKIRYNPITKQIEKTERKRKRTGKHARNLLGCYPGYKFTINGVEYECIDGSGMERPTTPIPVIIYPTPDNPLVLKPIIPEQYF